ncbi:uncharacterized protein LOC119539357 [Choloepus didactylus]|uniref:uncharacterized protein LOC119539357 n=1 Tax=Choloepus didactylus TaxID=27675 RepID=UPI0018A1038B|nr:uncharacterized protein LOC119539357 [Choloepus didactylus]
MKSLTTLALSLCLTYFSPCLPFSLQAPEPPAREGVWPGYTICASRCRGFPWVSQLSCPNSGVCSEAQRLREGGGRRSWAAPGAGEKGLEQASRPPRSDRVFAETPTVWRKRAKWDVCVNVKGLRTSAWGVVGARGVPCTLSRVGEFGNLGEVPARPRPAWFCPCPGRRARQPAGRVCVAAAATRGLGKREGLRRPTPATERQTLCRPAGGEARRSSVFTFAV